MRKKRKVAPKKRKKGSSYVIEALIVGMLIGQFLKVSIRTP